MRGQRGKSVSPVSLWLGSDVYVGRDSFTKLVFLGIEIKRSQRTDEAHQKWQQHHWVLPLTLLAQRAKTAPSPTSLLILIMLLSSAANKKAWREYPAIPLPPSVACSLYCLSSPGKYLLWQGTSGGQAAVLYTGQTFIVRVWSADTKQDSDN